MSLLQAQGLSKRFGDTLALNDFELSLEPGQIVGLIGPNGSGKTTALKSIMGLCKLDAGELQVLGMDPYRQRPALMARATYIADTGTLPRWMKIRDLLAFVAAVNPRFDEDAARRTLANTDIALHSRVRSLSKGMNVQLHLALVMASNAEVLVLDEPTLGLDVLYRQQFYDSLLNDYFEQQRAILLTTHEVREIEHILTHVVFIHRGKAVLSSAVDALPEQFTKVIASKTQTAPLEAANPISRRQTLQGVEYIFRGVERQSVADLGEISTPNLAELFVALVQGVNEHEAGGQP